MYLGAKVYLGCRSLHRANQAITDIQKETGVAGDKLSVILLDLASLKSVREFVQEFKTSRVNVEFTGTCTCTLLLLVPVFADAWI